jgi:hypothetical protein
VSGKPDYHASHQWCTLMAHSQRDVSRRNTTSALNGKTRNWLPVALTHTKGARMQANKSSCIQPCPMNRLIPHTVPDLAQLDHSAQPGFSAQPGLARN